ncbi:hypothetical protein LguiA_012135 [Lonicera macranthoides]
MQEDRCVLSSSMLVPYGGNDYPDHRQLAAFTHSTTASRFHLPAGWRVKEVLRPDGSRSDKYYYEPGTGLQFRSMREVERHVNGEEYTPRRQRSFKLDYNKISGSRKMIVSGGKIVGAGKSEKMLKLDEEELNQYQLAIVQSQITGSNPSFKLPDGWVVEEVPRRHGSGSDKYYYEPGTGQKFRSLREVERHLKAAECERDYHHKSLDYRKTVISGGKTLRLHEEECNEDRLAIVSSTTKGATPPNNLPDGWVVEEVPRRLGSYNDKYYYEPGTGQKFRSLVAVKKYLAELKEKAAVEKPLAEELRENAQLSEVLAELKEYNTPLSEVLAELKEYNTPLCKAFKLPGHLKNPGLSKKNMSREKPQNSSFNTPPTKINWVLAGAGGDTWNPYIGGKLVPESVKQQWAKRFMLALE